MHERNDVTYIEAKLEAYFVHAFETKLFLRLVEAVSNSH